MHIIAQVTAQPPATVDYVMGRDIRNIPIMKSMSISPTFSALRRFTTAQPSRDMTARDMPTALVPSYTATAMDWQHRRHM